jgi:hypothetical protein
MPRWVQRITVRACGWSDLSAAGGVHGLAEEHEDIRVEINTAHQAIRLLDDGVIEAGPAVVGLAWFARHHEDASGWPLQTCLERPIEPEVSAAGVRTRKFR